MHYPDLSPYQYLASARRADVYSVGWLEVGRAFAKGRVPPHILDCILDLCARPVNWTAGLQICSLCPRQESTPDKPVAGGVVMKHGGKDILVGSGEIWVKGGDRKIYAAPTMIAHYIRDHGYQPPQAFLDAVENGTEVRISAEEDAFWSFDADRRRSAKWWEFWRR
jgi:hypothetical protein